MVQRRPKAPGEGAAARAPVQILAAIATHSGNGKLRRLGAGLDRLGPAEERHQEGVVILAEGDPVAGRRDFIDDEHLALGLGALVVAGPVDAYALQLVVLAQLPEDAPVRRPEMGSAQLGGEAPALFAAGARNPQAPANALPGNG